MKKILVGFVCLIVFAACGEGVPVTEQSASSSISPTQWLTFEGSEDGKKIVLVSGDEEYRSEEVLPQMASILARHHGFNCTVLFAQDPKEPGIVNPNYLENIPGLEALVEADLMVIFTRFRALPDEQMQYIDDYLMKGKPVIAIRTATHAFNFKDSTNQWQHYGNYYEGEKNDWVRGFGNLVLGDQWYVHHGHHKHQSTRGIIAEGADAHPITRGIESGEIWGSTDVYGVRLPLPGDAQHIIMGQVVNRQDTFNQTDIFYGLRETDTEVATTNPAKADSGNPNHPMMPIAWTKSYKLPDGISGKAFTSTIGSSTDFLNEGVRRLFANASFWCLGLSIPEKAEVGIVGTYKPTAFQFHKEPYWQDLNLTLQAIKQMYQED